MGRYIEHNNHCSLTALNPTVPRLWFADAPDESYRIWCSYLAISRRSFDGWNAPSDSCPTRCSYFVIILNFCIGRPCGFQPIRIIIFHFFHFIFYVSNFCMDRPFGFSVHRDALFYLSRLFRFATYRTFHINKVFLDCNGIHRTYEFVTIFCN